MSLCASASFPVRPPPLPAGRQGESGPGGRDAEREGVKREGLEREGVLADLRRRLPGLEAFAGEGQVQPFNLAALDDALPHGGLALDALHEILPASPEDMGAALGFLVGIAGRLRPGRPLLFVADPHGLAGLGRLCGHGLGTLGLDPARLILAEPPDAGEALWTMEEALRSGVPAAVAGAVSTGLDLKASRRLHLAAARAGVPLLLLRPAAARAASAAATRWRVAAAPAGRDRFGLVARWRWRVALTRCRNGRTGHWLVEWDNGTHRFGLVAALADPALPGGAGVRLA